VEILRERCRPLRLSRLRRRLPLNLWPPYSVVVTFDDGYADNLHNALPLLQAADVPATVFVTAGHVGKTQAFWWEELEHVFLSQHPLPERLELSLAGETRAWDLAANGHKQVLDGPWHVLVEQEWTPRQKIYADLVDRMADLSMRDREASLDTLFDWAGIERGKPVAQRALSADEVRALADSGVVEVGAHTMSHPRLASLSPLEQQAEILDSKLRLEEMIDRPVTTFAYPFGSERDFDATTMRLVREMGFACACSTSPTYLRWDSHPYRLPRLTVLDWDGDEFMHRLSKWFVF
jgi:peptidoglycan/xylan/chitin deacetylase (PgdA/CDA1 family)